VQFSTVLTACTMQHKNVQHRAQGPGSGVQGLQLCMHSYRSNIELLCVCVSLEVFSVRTECPCPVSDSESVLNVRAQCPYSFSVLSVRAQ
jgi:hypothetical protein